MAENTEAGLGRPQPHREGGFGDEEFNILRKPDGPEREAAKGVLRIKVVRRTVLPPP